jgi:hypothetical protein
MGLPKWPNRDFRDGTLPAVVEKLLKSALCILPVHNCNCLYAVKKLRIKSIPYHYWTGIAEARIFYALYNRTVSATKTYLCNPNTFIGTVSVWISYAQSTSKKQTHVNQCYVQLQCQSTVSCFARSILCNNSCGIFFVTEQQCVNMV